VTDFESNNDGKFVTITWNSDDGSETFKVVIDLVNFRLRVYSDETLMIVVNPWDTLLVENTEYFHSNEMERGRDFEKLKSLQSVMNKAVRDINADFASERSTDAMCKYFSAHINLVTHPFNWDKYSHRESMKTRHPDVIDFHSSISMGFYLPETHHLYGIPERA
jgi:hypothetical protein